MFNLVNFIFNIIHKHMKRDGNLNVQNGRLDKFWYVSGAKMVYDGLLVSANKVLKTVDSMRNYLITKLY